MKRLFLQRSGLVLFVLVLLVVAAIAGIGVHGLSEQQKAIKRDYSAVNKVQRDIE
ncbi:MAG TPA: hypothetical protein VGS79_21350 [Puia sp.]|nr:hypothetical protein [Puia sp.]